MLTIVRRSNPDIPFQFSKDNMEKVKEIISHYPPQYKKAAVIPLLDLGQRQNSGWTSISVMNHVAEILEMVGTHTLFISSLTTLCIASHACVRSRHVLHNVQS